MKMLTQKSRVHRFCPQLGTNKSSQKMAEWPDSWTSGCAIFPYQEGDAVIYNQVFCAAR